MPDQITATRLEPVVLDRVDGSPERRPLLIASVLLLAAVALPTVWWLVGRWTVSIWHNGHGILMPAIIGMLVLRVLRENPFREEPSRWGFAFVVPAAVMIALDAAMGTQLLSAIALVFCLPGLSLLILGRRRTRALVAAFVLALFMLPIPAVAVEPLHAVLRQVAAVGSEYLLRGLGFSVYRERTTLSTQNGSVVVADACDGFSTLYAAAAMAVFLVRRASPARRVLIGTGTVACTFLCNTVRCAALAAAVSVYGEGVLESPLHVFSGVVSFVTTLLLLFLIAGSSARRQAFA